LIWGEFKAGKSGESVNFVLKRDRRWHRHDGREGRSMTLVLHAHPLSPFCQKVLMALYETETPFTFNLIDLGNGAARDSLASIWPIGGLPVLEDKRRGEIVPQASAIIEYVDLFYPGRTKLLPFNPVAAWSARAQDRFFDANVQAPVQKIVTDRLCPPGRDDPYGVSQAKAQLRAALDLLERTMTNKVWAAGDTFSIADCAAGPALWYANVVMPLERRHPHTAVYLDRLEKRPSLARIVKDAMPYQDLLAV
jgi:glutathione S-transferase